MIGHRTVAQDAAKGLMIIDYEKIIRSLFRYFKCNY